MGGENRFTVKHAFSKAVESFSSTEKSVFDSFKVSFPENLSKLFKS